MKKLLFIVAAMFAAVSFSSCDKDDDNGGGSDFARPALPDPDDVCSCMDDVVFMKYCYENFDVNKDGKVSKTEANAVTKIDLTGADVKTLTGIGYFPNLEIIICKNCSRLATADLSLNLKITTVVNEAFYKCGSLTSIILPASLKEIKEYVFSYCYNLISIYIKATIPPTLSGVGSSTTSAHILYVPLESVNAYKADEVWGELFEIFGYDF